MGVWPPEWYNTGGTRGTRNVASLEASEDRSLLASQTHPRRAAAVGWQARREVKPEEFG